MLAIDYLKFYFNKIKKNKHSNLKILLKISLLDGCLSFNLKVDVDKRTKNKM